MRQAESQFRAAQPVHPILPRSIRVMRNANGVRPVMAGRNLRSSLQTGFDGAGDLQQRLIGASAAHQHQTDWQGVVRERNGDCAQVGEIRKARIAQQQRVDPIEASRFIDLREARRDDRRGRGDQKIERVELLVHRGNQRLPAPEGIGIRGTADIETATIGACARTPRHTSSARLTSAAPTRADAPCNRRNAHSKAPATG